jgi:hypothetical protein
MKWILLLLLTGCFEQPPDEPTKQNQYKAKCIEHTLIALGALCKETP